MKRLISLLLALVLLALPMSALAENWYVREGMKLAGRVHALANEETYVLMYTAPGDIQARVESFADSDLSAPVEARMLSLPDMDAAARILGWLGAIAGEEIPEMSDVAMAEIVKQLPGMIVALFNNQEGVEWIAAASILKSSETYVMPEDFQPGILFLEYPGDYSMAVTFSQTGENTLTATATAVRSGLLDSMTEDMELLERIMFNTLFKRIELE